MNYNALFQLQREKINEATCFELSTSCTCVDEAGNPMDYCDGW